MALNSPLASARGGFCKKTLFLFKNSEVGCLLFKAVLKPL